MYIIMTFYFKKINVYINPCMKFPDKPRDAWLSVTDI